MTFNADHGKFLYAGWNQTAWLQAVKKGECKFVNSFGKSVFSIFDNLDPELQNQILSLKEINFAFIPSVNRSSLVRTSVQDNTRDNYYAAIRYDDFPRIAFHAAVEDTSSVFNMNALNSKLSR